MSGAVGSKPCLTRSGRPSRALATNRSSSAPSGKTSSVPAVKTSSCCSGFIAHPGFHASKHSQAAILGGLTRVIKPEQALRPRAGAARDAGSDPNPLDPLRASLLGCVAERSTPILTTTELHSAVRAARRFPWQLFLTLVVIAVFGSAGAVFGIVQWLGHDVPRPEQLTQITAPVKTVVYDAKGRVLHE